MIKGPHKISMLISVFLFVYALSGCADPDAVKSDEHIIRLGDSFVTVADYNRAFEIAKAAYPHNKMQDPTAVRNAKLRLLNQMSEEMIILERAKELGISIADREIEKAVSDIKKDYPEDVFEQILLEYAVPYDNWEKRVKIRLLMEKVIAKELGEQITITPDDISKYYEENEISTEPASDPKEDSQETNKNIVNHIRRKKVEAAYISWMKNLQKTYTVEINNDPWEKIMGN
ncbi:MAG: SurA N-terminal domain-containing protein [Desulfobacterales bacterium]|nr:MAG: SurA N-terminal domain-containing protein [Desulfobacterales bacterium]UCD89920.1 MAG: SurA N-terminal domain-containing protein [Desulfobacterales bacterium]